MFYHALRVRSQRDKPFAAITDADWRSYFEVNVLSGARLARAYFPGMLERNWGRIIFISSESASSRRVR
jgi:NAD(P)-dependent dehydrogenase (short-subunit alcohol dehydrogenase family)